MSDATYTIDPDVSFVCRTIGVGSIHAYKAPDFWVWRAEGPHMQVGYGNTPYEAVADLHRRKVLALMRKALGSDRRALCNTDKFLREANK